ncbi:hypothetical protein IGB42_02397 [Andreprevotia sp. IGB-42]|uniref:hypothetical protein n=1 Tax=Andreprevotia sp. IGB-42 TaxID=2497473 RepID=UPI00135B1356|nr:hypothetical protein [Andreprevotia sp. IGB-42]KAF0813001.1 hypothetical protein IGB42_02397 [Andreprevotia sp. IGB-42]
MIRIYSLFAAMLAAWAAIAALKKRAARPDSPLLQWPVYPLTDRNAARSDLARWSDWVSQDWQDEFGHKR